MSGFYPAGRQSPLNDREGEISVSPRQLDNFEEENEGEETKVETKRGPSEPSAEEYEKHMASGHAVFRDWCECCVKGQGKSDFHKRQVDKNSETVPTVSIDYAYMEEKQDVKEELGMPILVMKDRKSKMIMADVVPEEGRNAYAIKRMGNNIGILGHAKMIIKSDCEPAILALKDAVKSERSEEIMFEESPAKESESNGEVERAVQEVQGRIRSIKLGLEMRYGRRIKRDEHIVPWMIRHAAQMRNRIAIRTDGKTNWKILRGRVQKRNC